MFLAHQTGNKIYFKRKVNQPITAAENYGNNASTYRLWDGVGANNSYFYQLLICDDSFPVTPIIVISNVIIGALIFHPRTSVQRPLIPTTGAWPLTPMVLLQ